MISKALGNNTSTISSALSTVTEAESNKTSSAASPAPSRSRRHDTGPSSPETPGWRQGRRRPVAAPRRSYGGSRWRCSRQTCLVRGRTVANGRRGSIHAPSDRSRPTLVRATSAASSAASSGILDPASRQQRSSRISSRFCLARFSSRSFSLLSFFPSAHPYLISCLDLDSIEPHIWMGSCSMLGRKCGASVAC